jgi:regulator of protease activity HflC (stomatin/prohibitin superfamily)
VIYAIDPKQLINLHIRWQDRYQDNVVRPVVRAAIRDAVSQFGVEEIVSSKRNELESMISDTIQKGLDDNNLVMSDFLLRNIRFSDQYAQAVEQKQIAEQQALQAKLVVEQKKQEAEQARQVAQGTADAAVISAKGAADARVLQAEAEAKANTVLTQSLTPELLQYQYIIKLAPGVQTIFIPSGNQFILPLPNTAVGQ